MAANSINTLKPLSCTLQKDKLYGMQIISQHSCYVLKMGLAITVDFVRTPHKNELWSNMQTTLPQAPS